MRTVKEVAELTGVSVRTLQYYDETGVFKPTQVTKAGYRLYDEESLHTLQQVLFFKELDIPLKDIKAIMENPNLNKTEIFRKQKALLQAKRDRLDRLLALLSRLEKGEPCMSFQEFDLSEYVQLLEQFKNQHTEEVIRHWGSLEAFEDMIKKVNEDESTIAQTAVQYYGSVENYVAAIKESLNHFSENMEKMQRLKENGYVEENQRLMEQLVADITLDVRSKEVQDIVKALMNLMQAEEAPSMDLGKNYWDIMIDGYLHKPAIIEAVDKKHGNGAAKFIGQALQYYFSTQEKDV